MVKFTIEGATISDAHGVTAGGPINIVMKDCAVSNVHGDAFVVSENSDVSVIGGSFSAIHGTMLRITPSEKTEIELAIEALTQAQKAEILVAIKDKDNHPTEAQLNKIGSTSPPLFKILLNYAGDAANLITILGFIASLATAAS